MLGSEMADVDNEVLIGGVGEIPQRRQRPDQEFLRQLARLKCF
jgi:hypothetical protein